MMEEERDIELDPEAQQLFEQFGGLQAHQKFGSPTGMDDLAHSLLAEQKRHDAVRILMIQATYLLSRYLVNEDFSTDHHQEGKVFEQLSAVLDKMGRLPGHLGCMLIRYRGAPPQSDIPDKFDYEVVFGHHVVDSAIAPNVARRNSPKWSKLPDQLLEASTLLADYGVNNIFIRLSNRLTGDLPDYRLCLKILSGFRQSRQTGQPIGVEEHGQRLRVPIINDENLYPDPNLTLMAGLNRLSAKSMERLVDKVDQWMRQQVASAKVRRYTGVYNAALELPKVRAQVKSPPIELNNIKWLLGESESQIVSPEKLRIAQLALELAGASPQKVAKMIKSVYADDFAKINTFLLGERLHLSSDLLHAAGQGNKEPQLTQELLGNLQVRLDQVKDHVIDDIHVVEDTGTERSAGKTPPREAVDSRIYRMVSFYKGRSATRKKMVGMVHHPIQFTDQDFQILAKDFRIAREEAEALVVKLKGCFSIEGRFKKSAFAEAVPLFRQYEQKIFQFLWHHMKDVVVPQDRSAFLNALQGLTTQMNQPKRALKILLEDLSGDPATVQFSDNKAIMLANLILHSDKSLTDYDITPEDIVLSRHKIDTLMAEYAAWRIEKDHEAFSTKIQTIHKKLMEALQLGETSGQRIPAAMLLNLERELYIFLSLVGGDTSMAILRSAAFEYGDPRSEIFGHKESPNCMGPLLQNLRVALRGVGSLGTMEDVPLIESIKTQEETFGRLKNDRQHRAQVRHITEWVDEAVKMIKFRR